MKLDTVENTAVQEAIEWLVLLRSGEATVEDYQRYELWRSSDESHNDACLRIEATVGKIESLTQEISAENVRQTLLAPSSRRKFMQNILGLAAVGITGGMIANQEYPVFYLMSDLYTDTGQRKQFTLDDGSVLNLNARTALNIHFSDNQRRVELRSGSIIANVVDDSRPFVIHSACGQIVSAGAARFHIKQESGGIHLAVLESVVKMRNTVGESILVKAGTGLWFDHNTIKSLKISESSETAWTEGRLEVSDATLSSVIKSLRNYSTSIISLDSSIANLRVSGNFPLDNIPYTLDALAQTMPIAIKRTTGYWYRVIPTIV